MTWVICGILAVTTLAGVLLTAFTLPGLWFIVLVAILCDWWQDWSLYSYWTLGAAVAMGVVAEVLEIVASAAGAKSAGGSRRAAWGSIFGAIAGAIIGSIIMPVVGTIIGGAVGAGVGALVLERHGGESSWKQSAKVGAGAATGRLAATLIKIGFTVAVGILLTVAAVV